MHIEIDDEGDMAITIPRDDIEDMAFQIWCDYNGEDADTAGPAGIHDDNLLEEYPGTGGGNKFVRHLKQCLLTRKGTAEAPGWLRDVLEDEIVDWFDREGSAD
jgi:hypothetical protein